MDHGTCFLHDGTVLADLPNACSLHMDFVAFSEFMITACISPDINECPLEAVCQPVAHKQDRNTQLPICTNRR